MMGRPKQVLASRFAALAFFAFAFGCGGGGGGGGGASNPPAASNPPPESLSPTWSLARAEASQLEIEQADVDAVLDHVFTDAAVQSVMLVKDGYVVGERYASGASADSLGTSWSVAKSFYSAAIGVALDENWFESLDQPASDFLTEWIGTDKEAITIRNILEMRAGFPATQSIFYEQDQTAFALNYEKTREEGTTFVYSNPTSQLFEPLLLRATGLDAHSYLREKILAPIGIDTNQIGMWFDRTGANPITYFGLDLRPEDMARFGLLFARDGEWDGQQIVSQSYVAQSLQAHSRFYGFQWWVLNDEYFGAAAPINVVAALGLNGQKIYVLPDTDVVLVVQTIYDHSPNQGYTLSDSNFPNTCTARNSCPDSTGEVVASFNEYELMSLLEAIGG